MSGSWNNTAAITGGVESGMRAAFKPGSGTAMAAMSGGSGSLGLSPASTQGQASPLTSATTQSAGSSVSSTSFNADTTISANDFLTLLVTEMQNQDPTSTMDPNEYINQLTGINSLEQLISINQNLQTALGETSTASGHSAGAGATASATPALSQVAATLTTASPAAMGQRAGQAPQAVNESRRTVASGNLSSPNLNAAAIRVGQALSGQSRTTHGPASRDIPARPLP